MAAPCPRPRIRPRIRPRLRPWLRPWTRPWLVVALLAIAASHTVALNWQDNIRPKMKVDLGECFCFTSLTQCEGLPCGLG